MTRLQRKKLTEIDELFRQHSNALQNVQDACRELKESENKIRKYLKKLKRKKSLGL